MKSGWWIWTSTVILLALIGPEAEAGSTPRDLSGDAMQRHDSRMVSSAVSSTPGYFSSTARDSSGGAMQRDDSRMVSSPVMPFLGQFGAPYSIYIVYPPARSTARVKVQVQISDLVPTPAPTPPARPQFWTARCGDFVALDVSSTMNLMEEERKPCSR